MHNGGGGNVPTAATAPDEPVHIDCDSDDELDALLDDQMTEGDSHGKQSGAGGSGGSGKPQRNLLLRYGVSHVRTVRDALLEAFMPSEMEPRCVASCILELLALRGEAGDGGADELTALAEDPSSASPSDVTRASVDTGSLAKLMALRTSWTEEAVASAPPAASGSKMGQAIERGASPERRRRRSSSTTAGGVPRGHVPQGSNVDDDHDDDEHLDLLPPSALEEANVLETLCAVPLPRVSFVMVILRFFFYPGGIVDDDPSADTEADAFASPLAKSTSVVIGEPDVRAGTLLQLEQVLSRVAATAKYKTVPVSANPLSAMPSLADRVAGLSALFDAVDARRSGGVSWTDFFSFLLEASVIGRIGKRFQERKEFEHAYTVKGVLVKQNAGVSLAAAVLQRPRVEHTGGARVVNGNKSKAQAAKEEKRRKLDKARDEARGDDGGSDDEEKKRSKKKEADDEIDLGETIDAEPGVAARTIGGPIVTAQAIPSRSTVLLASARHVLITKATDPHVGVRYEIPIEVNPYTNEPEHKVLAATFLDRHSLVAVAAANGTVTFFFTAALRPRSVGSIPLPEGNATALCWFPRRDTLFAGSRTGAITSFAVAFDPATGLRAKKLRTVMAHADMINVLSVMPSESSIIAGSYDRTLTILDAKTLRPMQHCVGHHSAITSALHCPDFNVIVSGSFDPDPLVWHISVQKKPPLTLTDAGKSHQGAIVSLQEIPHLRSVASLDDKGGFKLWDMRFFVCTQTSHAAPMLGGHHTHHFVAMALHTEPPTLADPIGTTRLSLFTRSTGVAVLEYNLTQKRVPTKNTADDDPLIDVSVQPAARTLTTVSAGQVKVWDVCSSSIRDVFKNVTALGGASVISAAAVEPIFSGLVALGTRHGRVVVQSIYTGGVVATIDVDPPPGYPSVRNPVSGIVWHRTVTGVDAAASSPTAADAGALPTMAATKPDDAAWHLLVATGAYVAVLELLPRRKGISRVEATFVCDGVVRSIAASPSSSLCVVGDDTGVVYMLNVPQLLVAGEYSAKHAVTARLTLPLKPTAPREISCVTVSDELQLVMFADDDGQVAIATLKPVGMSPEATAALPTERQRASQAVVNLLAKLPRAAVIATWMTPNGASMVSSVARVVSAAVFGVPEFVVACAAQQDDDVGAGIRGSLDGGSSFFSDDSALRDVPLCVPLYTGDDAGFLCVLDLWPTIAAAAAEATAASQRPCTGRLLHLPQMVDGCFAAFPKPAPERVVGGRGRGEERFALPSSTASVKPPPPADDTAVLGAALGSTPQARSVTVAAAAIANAARAPRLINRVGAHSDAITSIAVCSLPAAANDSLSQDPSTVTTSSYTDAAFAIVTASADQSSYAWSASASHAMGSYDQYLRCPVKFPVDIRLSNRAGTFDAPAHSVASVEEEKITRAATFSRRLQASQRSSARDMSMRRLMSMTATQRRSLVAAKMEQTLRRRSEAALSPAAAAAAAAAANEGAAKTTAPVDVEPSAAARDAWGADRTVIDIPPQLKWKPPPSVLATSKRAAVSRPSMRRPAAHSPSHGPAKFGASMTSVPDTPSNMAVRTVSFAGFARVDSDDGEDGGDEDDDVASMSLMSSPTPVGGRLLKSESSAWSKFLTKFAGDGADGADDEEAMADSKRRAERTTVPDIADIERNAIFDAWRRRVSFYVLTPPPVRDVDASTAVANQQEDFSGEVRGGGEGSSKGAAANRSPSPPRGREVDATCNRAAATTTPRLPRRQLSREERLEAEGLRKNRPAFMTDLLPPAPGDARPATPVARPSTSPTPTASHGINLRTDGRPPSAASLEHAKLVATSPRQTKQSKSFVSPLQSSSIMRRRDARAGGDDDDGDFAAEFQPPQTPRALKRSRALGLRTAEQMAVAMPKDLPPLKYDPDTQSSVTPMRVASVLASEESIRRTSPDFTAQEDQPNGRAVVRVPDTTTRAVALAALDRAKGVGRILAGLTKEERHVDSIAVRPTHGRSAADASTPGSLLPPPPQEVEDTDWTVSTPQHHLQQQHHGGGEGAPLELRFRASSATPFSRHVAAQDDRRERLHSRPATGGTGRPLSALRASRPPTAASTSPSFSAPASTFHSGGGAVAATEYVAAIAARCPSAAGRRVLQNLSDARRTAAANTVSVRVTGSTPSDTRALPVRPPPVRLRQKPKQR